MKQVSLYPNGRVHTENSNQLMEINLLCFDPVHRWDQSSTAEVVVCFDRNKDPFPFVFHKPPIYSKHSLAHTVNSSTISIVIYFTSNHFNMWLHNIQNDLHKQNNKSSGLISTWLWQLRRWNFICIGIKSKPIHNMKDDIIIQTLPKTLVVPFPSKDQIPGLKQPWQDFNILGQAMYPYVSSTFSIPATSLLVHTCSQAILDHLTFWDLGNHWNHQHPI